MIQIETGGDTRQNDVKKAMRSHSAASSPISIFNTLGSGYGYCETKTAQLHSEELESNGPDSSEIKTESNAAPVHKSKFHTSLLLFQESKEYQSTLSETSAWFMNEILAGKRIELWEVESHFFAKDFNQSRDDLADLLHVIRFVNEQIKKEVSEKNQNTVDQDKYDSYGSIVREMKRENEN